MGQSFPSSHLTMIKLCLLSLSVFCVSSAPGLSDYLDYLPPALKDFVEDTIEDGTETLGELQENVEKEVFSKTSEHYGKIAEKMGETINELHGIVEKNDEIWEEYDITEAEQAELDEKLNEIKEDISEDDKIADDVEKMIQQQVNNFRASMLSMTKDWRAWHRNFYNSSELIVPATDIINNAAKDMKSDIADLFKTFREIDISKIGASDDKEGEESPRELED